MLGFLNIHKPIGVTSHDVVHRVRRLTGIKQVGHGGTLDPLAEGVLPVAVAGACRLLRYLPEAKIYKAEILLGCTTTTDDTEGETLNQVGPELIPDEQRVHEALKKFVGQLDQIPPIYSAIHHQGERLYALARKGAVIESIPSRSVLVNSIELLSFVSPKVSVRVDCGAGTYIRSIARDLGNELGCGGCLSALVRERSGAFHIDDAVTLEELAQAREAGTLQKYLVAPEIAILQNPDFLEFRADSETCRRINMGQKVEIAQLPAAIAQAGKRSILLLGEDLLSVCKVESNRLCPEVVIQRRAKDN